MKAVHTISSFLKKYKKIIITISILGLGGLFVFSRPPSQAPIATVTAKSADFVQSISVSGTVQAKNFANLNFLTGGKLVYLGVAKGDHVKQYQTIAMLDQRSTQKSLQTTLLDYSKQRNSFDQTQADNQNRTPQQALNDTMKRILQDNQYDLDKSVTSVALQSLASEQSILTAPIDGIVTRADVTNIGINISPATIFTVVDPTQIVFAMDVDEADIGKMNLGEKTAIVLDAFPNKTINLPISSIDFVSHLTTTGGTAYTVEAKIPENTNYQYKIGMNGTGEISIVKKSHVLSLPISAITDDNYVYVALDKNTFQKRKVSLGLQNDTDVEITKGIKIGEKIALDTTTASKQIKK